MIPHGRLLFFVVVCVLFAATVSFGAVTVLPTEAKGGTTVQFTLRVSNESRNTDTVALDVEFPSSLTITEFETTRGWKLFLKKDASGKIRGAIWSGGAIAPHAHGEFKFLAETPAETTELQWKVVEIDAKGKRKEYTGAKGSRNPSPVTMVKAVKLESGNGPWRDHDRDGVADDLEQELLLKFTPIFMVDAHDCDGMPAEFMPDSKEPRPIAKNGTIYGQVFRKDLPTLFGAFVEIHYYHLWSRDCGRAGHSLDAEHVSVLTWANSLQEPASAWKALYWYAATHEETLCEASNGAKASALAAEERGATVWVSRGKHGSFLNESKCRLGCGGETCRDMIAMPAGKLVNIGEADAPLNGAVWTGSKRWPLKDKMHTDFNDDVLARLEDSGTAGVISLNSHLPPTKAVILGGNSSLGAFLIGNAWAGRSLSIAGSESVHAAGRAFTTSGKSLLIVGRKLGAGLGFKRD